jgi:DNA-binding transcriptional MerR regulator/methylmalonyl-CoA mutase cobalamin-binding subunit
MHIEDGRASTADPGHPIEVAARRTGLSKDVLRAWERRYGVVNPARTESGRRLYSDHDILKLRLLRQATGSGRTIGSLVSHSTGELEVLVEEDQLESVERPGASEDASDSARQDLLRAHREECLAAIRVFDDERLKAALSRAMISLRPVDLIDYMISPLMRDIGEMWSRDRLDSGHERLATNAVRATLRDVIGMLHNPDPAAPELIVATPSGQYHEIGAMLAAATASTANWHVTHLGSHIPAEDIAQAAMRRSARAVALSIVYPEDDEQLPAGLVKLWNLLPADVPIIVGGAAADGYGQTLRAIGAKRVADLASLREILTSLEGPTQRGVDETETTRCAM